MANFPKKNQVHSLTLLCRSSKAHQTLALKTQQRLVVKEVQGSRPVEQNIQ